MVVYNMQASTENVKMPHEYLTTGAVLLVSGEGKPSQWQNLEQYTLLLILFGRRNGQMCDWIPTHEL